MIKEFVKNPKKYVVKSKDGRGGDAVFIGPKMSKGAISELAGKMTANKDHYIIQEVTNLSRLGNMIVDARLVSHVDRVSNLIPFTPWGRGLPIDGDGKVNLSANGKEVAIIPVPDAGMDPCHKNQKTLYRRGVSL
jgi:glutathione synthase/RimK-type ligase-like ATP-grasp enzyme